MNMICRFCLKEGIVSYKDLFDCNENVWRERLLSFAEILQDTFSIFIVNHNTYKYKENYLICEGCGIKLRDAFDFKYQIINNEKEMEIQEDLEQDKTVIKIVPLEEPRPDSLSIAHNTRMTKEMLVNKDKKQCTQYNLSEQAKRNILKKENALKLIKNTNLCLFRIKGAEFVCFCCSEMYLSMNNLRDHMTCKHKYTALELEINKKDNIDQLYADATDLQCKLCSSKLENLEIMRTHLLLKHNIETKLENFLIPFELGKGYNCKVCKNQFQTFSKLLCHMNCHFPNYVCDICGKSFINKSKLSSHRTSMHMQRCNKCNLEFKNAYDKLQHRIKIHKVVYERKCKMCESKFPNYQSLKIHMKNHGVNASEGKCPICDKNFLYKNNIKSHIQNVHRKEKQYSCGVCNRQFFYRYDMERHVLSHDETTRISCKYCTVQLKSKGSYKKHLRTIHSGLK